MGTKRERETACIDVTFNARASTGKLISAESTRRSNTTETMQDIPMQRSSVPQTSIPLPFVTLTTSHSEKNNRSFSKFTSTSVVLHIRCPWQPTQEMRLVLLQDNSFTPDSISCHGFHRNPTVQSWPQCLLIC